MLQEEKLSKGKNCRISVVISKSAENTAKEKIPQSLAALRDFRGGDYWTRTSDLLRVKIRMDIKCLLLGAFQYFWLHFFRTGKRAWSTVSTRYYPDIGQRIGQITGSAH